MTPLTSGHQQDARKSQESPLKSAESLIMEGGESLQRLIVNNPGIALAVFATVGVVLGCLIKRR